MYDGIKVLNEQSVKVQSILGHPLFKQKVGQKVGLIIMQVGAYHQEEFDLLLLEQATTDVIFGHLWLIQP